MNSTSILRNLEYKQLSTLELTGLILDVGGGHGAAYHDLIKGEHTFETTNFEASCNPDHVFDVEKPFPLESDKYDHAICLNVIEHVYEFDNAVGEQVRCIKSGGRLVLAAPFMFHIHGTEDEYSDFLRYTPAAYERMAKKYNCTIEQIESLGYGLFSFIFQSIGGSLPGRPLQRVVQKVFVGIDRLFLKLSGRYRRLAKRIPLGYFVVLRKN